MQMQKLNKKKREREKGSNIFLYIKIFQYWIAY